MAQEANRRETFEERQERKRQEFEARLEAQKAKRDWMMLIITCAAVAAAYWTGWEARRARLDAVVSAESFLRVQNQAMQIEQRPWALVVEGTWQSTVSDEANGVKAHQVSLKPILTVTGRTPALRIKISVNCGLFEFQDYVWLIPNMPADPTEVDFPLILNGGSKDIQCEQSETMNQTQPPPTSIQEVERLMSTKTEARIVGKIVYDDYFKQPHTTTFCLENISNISNVPANGKLRVCKHFLPEIT
ncbi:MAG TPA: hypothetical protein VFE57_09310 [Cyclobacteriaceae bacterium]|nr:hypothetical protein [Cyclobacteriaceae bacterium]